MYLWTRVPRSWSEYWPVVCKTLAVSQFFVTKATIKGAERNHVTLMFCKRLFNGSPRPPFLFSFCGYLMLSNKSLALALCLTITGCAQTPQNDAEGGHWWSFGSDKTAAKDAVSQTDAKPDAKPAAGAKPAAPATAAAPAPAPATAAPVAKADTGSSWWPFSSKNADAKAADAKADLKAISKPQIRPRRQPSPRPTPKLTGGGRSKASPSHWPRSM